MAKLTTNQRLFLLRISNGGHAGPPTGGSTFTLHSLQRRGLVVHDVGTKENGFVASYHLTDAGREALGLVVADTPSRDHSAASRAQLRERLHYTTSHVPSSRLCGAPASERGTVDTGAVTCPDCRAKLAALTPDHLRCRYTDCAEHHPAAREDEQVTCPTCRTLMGFDPIEPAMGDLASIEARIVVGAFATPPNRSWAPEVIADGSGRWCGNALRFATREEAEANVLDLSRRWRLVRETRVVESLDPVNYQWDVERGLVPCRQGV